MQCLDIYKKGLQVLKKKKKTQGLKYNILFISHLKNKQPRIKIYINFSNLPLIKF